MLEALCRRRQVPGFPCVPTHQRYQCNTTTDDLWSCRSGLRQIADRRGRARPPWKRPAAGLSSRPAATILPVTLRLRADAARRRRQDRSTGTIPVQLRRSGSARRRVLFWKNRPCPGHRMRAAGRGQCRRRQLLHPNDTYRRRLARQFGTLADSTSRPCSAMPGRSSAWGAAGKTRVHLLGGGNHRRTGG